MDLRILREYGKEFEKRLRLTAFPLAVKLLEKEKDIPKEAKRPKKDFGYHMFVCQGFALSRRDGITVAMLKEDMWCVEPVIGYGIAETPDYFLEGNLRFPQDVETLAAGRNFAEEFPRMESGKYIGVLSAPLSEVSFEPDVVIFYCDSLQLNMLLLGREFKDGRGVQCNISNHAACVFAVVPPMQNGKCQVAVPCRGDHYRAMAGSDEMIFSSPTNTLPIIIAGLRHAEEYGWKLPKSYFMAPESEVPESYMILARMVGMDI